MSATAEIKYPGEMTFEEVKAYQGEVPLAEEQKAFLWALADVSGEGTDVHDEVMRALCESFYAVHGRYPRKD